MSDLSSQHYLLNEQYKDASNLNARIQLHQRFGTSKIDWHHWVFEQFALTAGSRILELGSGPGHLWQKNLDRIPPRCQITLSDFSEGMLQEAKNNLAESAERFSFQLVDAQSIPFEDASFDVVIANHMLYHVPDHERAFSEIRRVLQPQGRFYAATNGEAHLQEIRELVQRVFSSSSGRKRSESSFSLENGAAQLAPWFSHVQMRPYDDALVVTEVEPLVAFVLSTRAKRILTEEQVRKLREIVAQELARNGSIAIMKATGLFVACSK
ncbi:MAG TPA: class I SAM-dependent methyltransferase [Ktedonobacteraceae bacterium]|nr:class I SAM-dependent methyltransferase [Ktedonobacteraceae bacterium]